jgi:DNA-binding MarR family transcriptional regulator
VPDIHDAVDRVPAGNFWFNWVRAQRRLTSLQRLLLMELADNATAGIALPSAQQLADYTETPERSVVRALHQLAERGLIKLVEGTTDVASLTRGDRP